jgi:hypothetical protein
MTKLEFSIELMGIEANIKYARFYALKDDMDYVLANLKSVQHKINKLINDNTNTDETKYFLAE